jgi:hypothetical protein
MKIDPVLLGLGVLAAMAVGFKMLSGKTKPNTDVTDKLGARKVDIPFPILIGPSGPSSNPSIPGATPPASPTQPTPTQPQSAFVPTGPGDLTKPTTNYDPSYGLGNKRLSPTKK